jgi:DNA repair ATPase RecN
MSDNVTDATPEILKAIQASISALESKMEARFENVEARFEKVEAIQRETLTILGEVSKGIKDLAELSRMHGGRLNTVDARLARIEAHLGFVEA